MYRASTPKHVFTFDFNPDRYFKRIQITYAQDNEIILTKEKEDLVFDTKETACGTAYTASFQLTQEETKLFEAGTPAQVQIRCFGAIYDAPGSAVFSVDVWPALNDTVLGGG